MRTIVLSEPGLRLGINGEEFRFENERSVTARVRAGEVSQILLMGQVDLTPAARAEVLKRGIDTVFLTTKGRYLGRLVGQTHGNIELRIAQYQRLLHSEGAAAAARAIVRGKLLNQRRLLQRVQNRRPLPVRSSAILRLAFFERQLAQSTDLAQIRGMEGIGAADYFSVFGTLVTNPEFAFIDRNRRPPRDPINAMLSFGYALLQSIVENAVYRAGLDPHLGALHAPGHGAPGLVFDLMEEFRPLAVDSVVIDLVNHRAIGLADFRVIRAGPTGEEILGAEAESSGDSGGECRQLPALSDNEVVEQEGNPAEEERKKRKETDPRPAVFLGEIGRKILIQAFFKRLRRDVFYPPRGGRFSNEQIIVEQAYHFARWLKGDTPSYQPYTPR